MTGLYVIYSFNCCAEGHNSKLGYLKELLAERYPYDSDAKEHTDKEICNGKFDPFWF